MENTLDIHFIPMSDDIHGIHDMVSTKWLHTFVNGIYDTYISKFCYVIGQKNKIKTDKNELDELHHRINHLNKIVVSKGYYQYDINYTYKMIQIMKSKIYTYLC